MAVGTRKDLSTLFSVDMDGKLHPPGHAQKVATRRQEVEKERLRQQNALAHQQQAVAENLVNGGPDAAAQALQPVSRLPKQRTPERRLEIKALLKKMPCFRGTPERLPLLRGKDIFVNSAKALILKRKYVKNPKKHFGKLPKLLIPKSICSIDGVSATGTRYCEPIPQTIISVALAYVSICSTKVGVDPDTMPFDPHSMVQNHIENTRKKLKKRAASDKTASSSSDSCDDPEPVEVTNNAAPPRPHSEPDDATASTSAADNSISDLTTSSSEAQVVVQDAEENVDDTAEVVVSGRYTEVDRVLHVDDFDFTDI